MELGARSRSAIFNDLMDPFYPLAKEVQKVVYNDPPFVLLPKRGVSHDIDLVS